MKGRGRPHRVAGLDLHHVDGVLCAGVPHLAGAPLSAPNATPSAMGCHDPVTCWMPVLRVVECGCAHDVRCEGAAAPSEGAPGRTTIVSPFVSAEKPRSLFSSVAFGLLSLRKFDVCGHSVEHATL